jgi:putative sterol carrier protein
MQEKLYEFASQEWLDAFVAAINGSKKYEEAAKDWEGDFNFILEPGGPINERRMMYLDLWHGKCRKAELVLDKDIDKYKPEFTIAGTLATWRKINEKKLDGTQALLTRQLKLTGNMSKVMRATGATRALSEATQTVKAVFPE